MSETTKKNDFIEIEYLGKTNGEVFDTNIPVEAKKINPDADVKPLTACIGQGMVIKGFDQDLENRELNKKYTVVIPSKLAYGARDPKMVRLIPKKVFLEHNMNPVPGMSVAMDNSMAKIVSVSGGRVLVDFNHPLANKELTFEYTIKNKLIKIEDKIKALQNAFFRQEFEYKIDNEKKKIIFNKPELTYMLNVFKDKFKESIGYDVEIFAKTEKKEEKEKTKTETPEQKSN
jgi:FKBP-type peptidyl-prolyl cis-trans isomerase 2